MICCDEVRRLAYFFLDGALPAGRQNEFTTHLHDCPDCDHRVAVHKRIRAFVQHRVGRESASESLRSRIRAGLRAAALAPQPELA